MCTFTPSQMTMADAPEGKHIIFEHGPFGYEQENSSVEGGDYF